ncbi:hypothetical protein MC885_009971 [Smutsia gigantea]|nr:hypothetical protein MC885_009971 [Smutsia gigantea]
MQELTEQQLLTLSRNCRASSYFPQAKEEALAETDQYRMQRDKEFQLRQSEVMGSQSNISEEIEEQTLAKMKELKEL